MSEGMVDRVARAIDPRAFKREEHLFEVWMHEAQDKAYRQARAAIEAMTEMPASVRKMMDDGWEFRWEPETRFIGAYHPRGGKISVLEVRDPRFADIGAWIDAALKP